MNSRTERILILCKTYPSPSQKYAETSCVAGITESAEWRRLYPVPFRMISNSHQFKKWQWIAARVARATDDRRLESHRIFVDTIELQGTVPTTDLWRDRIAWLDQLPIYDDFNSLEEERTRSGGPTLALLRPSRVTGLEITPVRNPIWTEEEKEKLLKLQRQGHLFEETERDLRTLRKLPFDFHYNYECHIGGLRRTYRHKIVDWEAGALFWNVRNSHGQDWEAPFRAKLESEFAKKDLLFLMGTIHRFPDQWLIVSLLYPPKQPTGGPHQQSLLLQ